MHEYTRNLAPGLVFLLAATVLIACFSIDFALAHEVKSDKTYELQEVKVNATKSRQLSIDPQKSTIRLDNYKSIGFQQNVADVVKEMPSIDYRGTTDLVPDDDTLYLRGFDSQRFVTAIDGSTIRKSGGRRSSHIVDYALLPPFLIESVEVLPGPHSALYPAKAIGGVVDFKTREPKRRKTLKPDGSVSVSYRSYNTQNHQVNLSGSAQNFTYDLGYQKYSTDGYLRNNEANFDTVVGRLGYLLPNDGYVTLTASFADLDREIPVNNNPDNNATDYEPDYPVVKDAARFNQWQDPTWDKKATNYRLNLKLPTLIGTWRANAYYGEENRDYSMLEYKKRGDPDSGITDGTWETKWRQQGGKITDTFHLASGHETTIGTEMEQLFDGYGDIPGWDNSEWAHDDKKRVETISGFAEHKWKILPHLSLTGGLRFEDDTIWVSNHSSSSGGIYITGRGKWIERSWNEWIPKSFLTYKLDGLAPSLRDTSLSMGISKIWHAPDYHGDYNPQGKPTGAWLDPEHGVGLDLIFKRRLLGDINMKVNYAYYEIEDYMAGNEYPDYGNRRGDTSGVPEGLEYKDYHINLEEVVRQGIDIKLNGHLSSDLYFLLGYAWQDFEYQGDKYPASAKAELDERAEHFVNAKLTYQLTEPTSLILDYQYQDEQVTETSKEVEPDVYEFNEIEIDSFQVVDLSVEHTLFEDWHGLKQGMFELYVNNMFNEDYKNTSGYPATDLTVGTGLSFQF